MTPIPDHRVEALALLQANTRHGWYSADEDARRLRMSIGARNRAEIIPVFLLKLREHQSQLLELKSESGIINRDLLYRYYHQSFEVFGFQEWVGQCVCEFHSIFPGVALHDYYREIALAGLAETFHLSFNSEWTKHTRPVVEAAMHTGFFLDALCTVAASDATEVPQLISAQWGLALYLWDVR